MRKKINNTAQETVRMPDKLRKFLKENNAYENYLENIKSRSQERLKDLYSNTLIHMVDGAFMWHLTKEGIRYWQDIQDKAEIYEKED